MLTIRLARAGAKKRPFFHITVADSRKPRDGRFIERVGFFNPREDLLEVDKERVDHWVSKGAQLSDRVNTLLIQSQETEEETKHRIDIKAKKKDKRVARKEALKVSELEAAAPAEEAVAEEAAPAEEAVPAEEAAPAEEAVAEEEEAEAAPAEEAVADNKDK